MNATASDVAPAVAPSSGRGTAWARVAATRNPAPPASVDPLGRSTTRAWIAATAANAPAAATGRTMGSVRLVSAGMKSLDQRRRRRRLRNRLAYGPRAFSVMPLAPILRPAGRAHPRGFRMHRNPGGTLRAFPVLDVE